MTKEGATQPKCQWPNCNNDATHPGCGVEDHEKRYCDECNVGGG